MQDNADAVLTVVLDRLLNILIINSQQFTFDCELEEVKTELLFIKSFLKDEENVKGINQTEILKTLMTNLKEIMKLKPYWKTSTCIF